MGRWKLIIYSPAYNASDTLTVMLSRFRYIEKQLSEKNISLKALIFVNDGSKDNTADIILKEKRHMPYLFLVDKEKNEGPAAALFDGMKQASKLAIDTKNTIVIRMDSDLEHQPEDIEQIIRPIVEGRNKVSAGYVPFDSRSGMLTVWFNKQIGVIENQKYLNQKIPQFCPGFNAVRGDLFLELLPKLKKMREQFIKDNDKDMLTIDFIILALAHNLGNDVAFIKLSPIENKWIKKIPLGKILSYFDYHRRTIKFLKKALASI